MITKIIKNFEIELTAEELSTLARARDILNQIVDFAEEENIAGFDVAQGYDNFYLDEFSNCMSMLDSLCHPYARLVGYFDEDNK